MANKQHCFQIKDALTGKKLIGGVVTADTMEDAAKIAIQNNNVIYKREEFKYHVTHKHLYKDREVYVYITAHPEYLK